MRKREGFIREIAFQVYRSHQHSDVAQSAHDDWLEAEMLYEQALEDGASEVDIHSPQGWFSTVRIG